MRILETALVVSCLPILGMSLLGYRGLRIVAVGLLLAPAVVLVAHAAFEGLRSPMIPIYLVASLLGLVGLSWMFSPAPFPSLPAVRWGALCVLAVLAAGTVFAWSQSAFELPSPAGPHPVGVTEVTFGDGKQVPQGLSARIWYPARTVEGQPAPYVPSAEKARNTLSPHVLSARTHAGENAGLVEAPEKLPVILYSPPWDGRSFQNTALFEALASAGFVVVALNLPGEGALPPWDFSTEQSMTKFRGDSQRQLETRTAHIFAAKEALSDLNSGRLGGGRFQNRLDLNAVGAVGYSFGGAVVAEALFREPRLRSGVNLDGVLFGESARSGAKQPFLFITDDMPEPTEQELRSPDGAARRSAEFYAQAFGDMHRWLNTRGGLLIRFDETDHGSFSDSPLYLTGKDWKKAAETLRRVNLLTVEFFDETLRGRQSSVLEKDSLPWRGVELKKFPAKSP